MSGPREKPYPIWRLGGLGVFTNARCKMHDTRAWMPTLEKSYSIGFFRMWAIEAENGGPGFRVVPLCPLRSDTVAPLVFAVAARRSAAYLVAPAGRVTLVSQTGPKRAVLGRSGQEADKRKTPTQSGFLVSVRTGQDRSVSIRIPLGLFYSSLFYKSFRDT
jgi:hypothetical protein